MNAERQYADRKEVRPMDAGLEKEVSKTLGINPKVPAQAVASIVAFVAALAGFDLSPELSAAIATVIGLVAGFFAKPGVIVTEKVSVDDGGEVVIPLADERGQVDFGTVLTVCLIILVVVAIVKIA